MLTQPALLELARAAIAAREGRTEPVTFYRVSKELGITSAYMSKLRDGAAIVSAELAHKLAKLAGIDPGYAMACIEAERAERDHLETTGSWRAIAQQLAGKAAAVLVAVILSVGAMYPDRAQASTYARAQDAVRTVDLYIMRSIAALQRGLNRWLARFMPWLSPSFRGGLDNGR